MSVRIDASGDSLSRTTNLPTITGFTIMGWFYLVSDRGSATYQAVFSFGDSTGSEYYVVYWEGGTNGRWGAWNGSTEYTHGSLGPSTGIWYHVSATVAGTGASQFLIYIHDIAGAQVATLTGSGYTGPAAQKIWIGNDNDSEFSNERAAAIKVYDAVLTQAEIQQEMFSILPQRTANINSWYPCLPGATERLADYSGNGYNWTAGGTLTDEDPPPVGWGGRSILFPYAAAGGTTYNQTVAGGMTPAGAIFRDGRKLPAGTITPSGAKIAQTNKNPAGSITPAGTETRQTAKAFAGGLTPSGVLTSVRTFLKDLSGTLASAGALLRDTGKAIAGAIVPTGVTTKNTSKTFAGGVTPSGALATIRTFVKSLTGVLDSSGILSKQSSRILAGGLSPVGTVTKIIDKILSGIITPSGTLSRVRTFLLSLSGTLTSTGEILKATGKNLSGSITPTGGLSRLITKAMSGIITGIGTFAYDAGVTASAIIRSWTLKTRSTTMTLEDRDTGLTLKTRSTAWTVDENER